MKNRLLLSIITVVLLFISCGEELSQKDNEINQFADLISAYTGGEVSSSAPIIVELANPQKKYKKGDVIKDDLFKFSPSIKGSLYCVDDNRFQFIPEEQALKRGVEYKATFALGKIIKVDDKFNDFNFTFKINEQDFDISVRAIAIKEDNPNLASVGGQIVFRDFEKKEIVDKLLTAKRGSESFTPIITAIDGRSYTFVFDNIPIKNEDTKLSIESNEKVLKTGRKYQTEVFIPGSKFSLIEYAFSTDKDNCFQLIFSHPISTSQDLRGIIVIDGVSNYKLEIDNNIVNIYYEKGSKSTEIEVVVDASLKSSTNVKLGISSSFKESIQQIKPQIEFLSQKNILPSTNNRLIPFKAVNLYSVDLKIIKIYENNILMFLQDNSLSGSDQLRRSGRLIHNERIALDRDNTKDIHSWNHFSIDISKYIEQEPGAIYRIILDANINYSAYKCEDNIQKENAKQSHQTISTQKMDLEDRTWDTPSSYYYDYTYWGDYEWSEREDPCKPSYYIASNCKASVNILSSDIGIIVKGNSENRLWVALSDIITTKPLSKAKVELYNYQLHKIAEMETDASGFADFELNNKPFVIVAYANGQKSYLKLTDGSENNMSRLDVGGQFNSKGLKGFIYGERGIWRPGDTLYVSFMLHDRENRIPKNHPVSFELFNSRGQFYNKQVNSEGVDGIYSFTVATDRDDPTGIWNAYVKVGGATFHKQLRIETFRPNRLKIDLALLDGNKIKSSNSKTSIKVTSAWLTGALSPNLKTSATAFLRKNSSPFSNYKSFIFNNPASEFSANSIELFDGVLGDRGESVFTFDTPEAKDAPGMLQANVVCNVYEPGGDLNIATKSFLFSPFDSYVGINLKNPDKSSYFETDSDLAFDIVALDNNGILLENADIEYKIFKISWSWWWENDYESMASYINSKSIVPVKQGDVAISKGKGKIYFKLNYPEWGRYLVYVKDKKSGHATGGAIYIDWPDWRGRSDKQDPSSPTILSFTLSKDSYELGEDVTAIIPRSSKGRALVAIENGSTIISREWIELSEKEDTKYTFKATKDMTPNAYLHVTLLQPHDQTVNELPIRMYGVLPIFVTNKASVLNPEITVDEVLRPETEFTVKIKEKNGRGMSYTLAIVDEGLLSVNNFKTPNPWNLFYAREALGIKTWDLFDDVIGSLSGKFGSVLSIGGDENILDLSDRKANRFKPVVKYLGPFTVKAKGENKHKITLPPYVGAVRIMTVAKQDDAFGSSEKSALVRSPLMLLSSLPRVMSINEKVSLPVNIFAMEKEVKDVTVKIETNGLLKCEGSNTKKVHFDTTGDKLVSFDLYTSNLIGMETVVITATSGKLSIKETVELDIRNPNPHRINRQSELIETKGTSQLSYSLDGVISDSDWARMEVSRIPSIDINSRFDYLYNYDHSCTEQLVSKAFPLLFIKQFKKITEKEEEMINGNIREAISKLSGRQNSRGAFTYWPGYTTGDEWVTSYAGSFLLMAREKGYEVNPSIINKWKKSQNEEVQNWRLNTKTNSRFERNQSALIQAYRLYTLAQEGSPALGAMNRMKANDSISTTAKWRLAAAYALAGQKKAAQELLYMTPSKIEKYSLNNNTYGSSLRDEAMILETLIVLGRNEDAFKMAEEIAKSFDFSSNSTQTNAYCLIALGRLSEKMSGKLEYSWSLNGGKATSVESSNIADIVYLPTDKLKGSVKVDNKGAGLIYLSLVSKSTPLIDTIPASNNNLFLEIKYKDLNGKEIDVTSLKQSTQFFAEITVTNLRLSSGYTNLYLEYIIPSGWEIFNENLHGAAGTSVNNYNFRDIRDDRVITYFDLKAGTSVKYQIRLSSSYAGSYVLPATYCEAMYDSSIYARTKAFRVMVNP